MTKAAYTQLTYELRGRTALITFARPNQMNSWNNQMGRELRHALAHAEGDKTVFGIVITGSGRAFCAGADISELKALGKEGVGVCDDETATDLSANPGTLDLPEGFSKGVHSYFATVGKPLIAAVNGAAAGLGFSIILHCDMRFFGESAFIASSFSKLGLPAEAGVAWLLPKLIGLEASFDILWSSRKVKAEEAKQLGLTTRICSDDTLVEEAVTFINNMATSCSPASMALIKGQLYRDLSRDPTTSLAEALHLTLDSINTPDFREGVKSFMEKRTPQFEGIGKS